MNTYIVYCDETGDDGNNTLSSDTFVLTTLSMPAECWQSNYDSFKQVKRALSSFYGFPYYDEIHTKALIADKDPYHGKWDPEERRKIIAYILSGISKLDFSVVNVVIDKTKIIRADYHVLENALTYNIQRIENTSAGEWNYIIITDRGRTAPMRKTARALRAYNPIPSFDGGYRNLPVKYMIEDIMEKDSKESFFIQICDFISYFVSAYYKIDYLKGMITGRASRVISEDTVREIMRYLDEHKKFNRKASSEKYGLVIYPK